jgi:hypothetical protein
MIKTLVIATAIALLTQAAAVRGTLSGQPAGCFIQHRGN